MTDRLMRIEAAVEELKQAFQDYAGQPSDTRQEFAARDSGKTSKFGELILWPGARHRQKR
jgi:hypothetical protein